MNINQNKKSKNIFFMRLALQQAYNYLGNTKENPSVGCVVVKNNNLVAAASTSLNGRPHAETNVIKLIKKNNGGNLYVTLEPCSHYGKTKPCTKAISNAKLRKVFFSINDPDYRSYNKSQIYFKKKDIYINKGLLSKKIKTFYNSYFKFKKSELPFVSAKFAVSKDFYSINKKKKWITNIYSRGRVHLIRYHHDCILTSVKTLIKDNSKLNCRIDGLDKYSPARIVLDKNLTIPNKSFIVKSAKKYTTIIFFNKINKKKMNYLKNSKIKLLQHTLNKDGEFNLKSILMKLKNLGFSRILLESGLNLTDNFLNNNLVDEFYLFISNKKLGKYGEGSFKKSIKSYFKNKKPLTKKVNLFGDKLFFYRLK